MFWKITGEKAEDLLPESTSRFWNDTVVKVQRFVSPHFTVWLELLPEESCRVLGANVLDTLESFFEDISLGEPDLKYTNRIRYWDRILYLIVVN